MFLLTKFGASSGYCSFSMKSVALPIGTKIKYVGKQKDFGSDTIEEDFFETTNFCGSFHPSCWRYVRGRDCFWGTANQDFLKLVS